MLDRLLQPLYFLGGPSRGVGAGEARIDPLRKGEEPLRIILFLDREQRRERRAPIVGAIVRDVLVGEILEHVVVPEWSNELGPAAQIGLDLLLVLPVALYPEAG